MTVQIRPRVVRGVARNGSAASNRHLKHVSLGRLVFDRRNDQRLHWAARAPGKRQEQATEAAPGRRCRFAVDRIIPSRALRCSIRSAMASEFAMSCSPISALSAERRFILRTILSPRHPRRAGGWRRYAERDLCRDAHGRVQAESDTLILHFPRSARGHECGEAPACEFEAVAGWLTRERPKTAIHRVGEIADGVGIRRRSPCRDSPRCRTDDRVNGAASGKAAAARERFELRSILDVSLTKSLLLALLRHCPSGSSFTACSSSARFCVSSARQRTRIDEENAPRAPSARRRNRRCSRGHVKGGRGVRFQRAGAAGTIRRAFGDPLTWRAVRLPGSACWRNSVTRYCARSSTDRRTGKG